MADGTKPASICPIKIESETDLTAVLIVPVVDGTKPGYMFPFATILNKHNANEMDSLRFTENYTFKNIISNSDWQF